jgi:phenylacetyl-CoA:acceptor oxidoreductase subunit 2
LVRDNAHFQMHAELETDPQIKYLYEVPNATPGRDPAPEDFAENVLDDPANPLVGQRQTFWDERAAMNFTMGGAASGLALAAFVAYLVARASGEWPFVAMGSSGLLAPYLFAGAGMAVGLFFVFLEIGRKARFLYVLRRPQSSWMTRETYAVAVFYPALAADLLWPGVALHVVVAIAAAAFLYCQARIIHAGKGVPAWRSPLVPWMLMAAGLFEGFALLLALAVVFGGTGATTITAAAGVIVFGIASFWLWRDYVYSARAQGIGPLARRALAAATPLLHVVGHALPVLGAVLALALGAGAGSWAGAVGSLAAVAGGAIWKFAVITRAGHMQGFALPKMPRRGSGKRAAPARLQPI